MSLEEHPAEAPGGLLPCKAPFPARSRAEQRCLPGLAAGSAVVPWIQGTTRAVRIALAALPRAEQLCCVSPKPATQAPGAGSRPRKHSVLSEKPGIGAGCLARMAATWQAQGANPGGAAQGSKYHRSGAVFFSTVGLTLCIYLLSLTARHFYANTSVVLLHN